MKDAVVDIETLGLVPGCVVTQVGVAFFDPETLEVDEEVLTITLDIVEQLQRGMWTDRETVQWWSRQDQTLREQVLDRCAEKTQDGVRRLVLGIIEKTGAVGRVWPDPAQFDIPILEELLRRFGHTPPWNRRDPRDARTLRDVSGLGEDERVRSDRPHHAGCDAYATALTIANHLRYMRDH